MVRQDGWDAFLPLLRDGSSRHSATGKKGNPNVPRPKDILIACLALSSGVLAVFALRQRMEIRALSAAFRPDGLVAPPLAIHSASKRRFALAKPPTSDDVTGRVYPDAGDENRPPQFPFFGDRPPLRPSSRRGGGLTHLMENPEFVQALSLQRHASLDTRFAGLFRELNLGADELAAFKGLLVDKENVALDVVLVSETLADGPLSPDSLRASVRVAQAQVEQAILSSLGSERYAVYRDYERTLAQRATVAQLEQRLSYTDTPLAAGQADALVRILSAHAPSVPVETAPIVSVLVRAGVPEAVPIIPTNAATGRVTDDVIVQSQTVLVPAQIQALRELQNEQQAALKAAELIRQVAPKEPLPGAGIIPMLQ
jgi:hypothetical protein